MASPVNCTDNIDLVAVFRSHVKVIDDITFLLINELSGAECNTIGSCDSTLFLNTVARELVDEAGINVINLGAYTDGVHIGCDQVADFMSLVLKSISFNDDQSAKGINIFTTDIEPEAVNCGDFPISIEDMILSSMVFQDDCYGLLTYNIPGDGSKFITCENAGISTNDLIKTLFVKIELPNGSKAFALKVQGGSSVSCTICEPDGETIEGISDVFTVDGWYLQYNAQNLVYMESGVIVGDPVPCASGIANYYKNLNLHFTNGFAGPYKFDTVGGSWQPILDTEFLENGDGVTLDVGYWTNADIINLESVTLFHKDAPDSEWHEEASSSDSSGAFSMPYTNSLRLKMVMVADGCSYSNPGVLGEVVCKERKSNDFQYQVPSADPPGSQWIIYPIAVIPEGLTVDMQGSTDAGGTWNNLFTDVDPATIDGLTPFATGSTSIRTRLKFTDIWGCIYYSEENTNTE